MSAVTGLRQVWRQPRFRRLLWVKLWFQSADGMVQVGVASHTLLSPERQPGAWAIVGVLAVTMLPFSIVGPFVSVVIDRWDRRRTLRGVDTARSLLCLLLSALVGWRAGGAGTVAVLAIALVLMGLGRFQVAALMASLPHTIYGDEYLAANTALPLIGPFTLMAGALVAAAIRLTLGRLTSPDVADGVIFLVAGALFGASVIQCRGFARRSLGPEQAVASSLGRSLRDLRAALAHLAARSPALLGVVTVAVTRLVFGFVTVTVILIYRNHFHAVDEVDAAVADLALWVVATGAGSLVASAVNAVFAPRLKLRRSVVAALAVAALCQALPASIITRGTLVAASFCLALCAQAVRINVDTLVQAHVDDEFKGRVLVIYDLAFNAPLVLAGLVVALVLPADGLSRVAFLACAMALAVLAVVFARRSRAIGPAEFDRGTESVTGLSTGAADE